MAFDTSGLSHGFFTAVDGTLERFRFVQNTGTTVALATAAGAVCGVCELDNPNSGQAVNVKYVGVAMVEASAAISANAEVEVATGGKAVTRTSGVIVGKALAAASGAGAIIPVLLETSYSKADALV